MREKSIPRGSLQDPKEAAMISVLTSNSDQAYITKTGLDVRKFRELHSKFHTYFEKYTPYSETGHIIRVHKKSNAGRPRLFTSETCLACVLNYTRTRGSMNGIQCDFGISYSCLSIWIRFGRRILIKILKKNKFAQIKIPTAEEWELMVFIFINNS